MKIKILGTGTSRGVPEIGCSCEVCHSNDPRDKRLRVSVLISTAQQNILIDAGPDFRQQLLGAKIDTLSAILLTHEHNDHIIGLDDVRPFIYRQKQPMPVYCTERVSAEVRGRFSYAFTENPYPGAPQFNLHLIDADNHFSVGDLNIQPIHYLHGHVPVLGFRVGDFAYLTDLKTIDEEELDKVRGIDTLVISALHRQQHHSHLSLEEALDLVTRIAPKRAFFTHLSHNMGLHQQVEQELPKGVHLAYDGLELNF